MTELRKIQPKYILLILFIILVITWSYTLYSVFIKAQEIDNLGFEVGHTEQRKESINDLIKQLSATEDKRQFLASHFIDQEDLLVLIEQIEDLAKNLNVFLETREIKSETELSLVFRLDANLEAIIEFLTALDKLPYVIRFDELNLGTARLDQGSDWQGNLQITVLSYGL
jgi:hypothetical protein